jgi:MinD-like ATPase involved in chromosome partitioning or flagellar assembly
VTRVIGICSGKGGVGKTTIAINLSIALKDFGKKVLIIDCNLSTPHLPYYLGAKDYKYTINDVLKGKVDIISAINPYYGLKYIAASLNLQDIVIIEPSILKKQIKKLVDMRKFDFIILDAAPGLGREVISVLDAVDEVIFVTNPYAPMINDVIRTLEVLKQIRGNRALSVILNMTTSATHEIFSKTLTELTGIPVIGEVPFDKNVPVSLAAKTPILNYKPNSIASIHLKAIAASLAGVKYKLPVKAKLRKLLKSASNFIVPKSISIPQNLEEVKEEIFIQRG